MKIVCLSDTHGTHRQVKVPEGDILIHAGDFSLFGDMKEVIDFNAWLGTLPHPSKIIIAGNHDLFMEKFRVLGASLITNATYLENSGTEVEGIHIWGSPITPEFNNWAFNRKRGEEINRYWEAIPDNTDVLITHGPPYGFLDQAEGRVRTGCKDLLKRVEKIKPKFHIFGHLHMCHGLFKTPSTTFVNASIVNDDLALSYSPLVVEY